MEIKIGVQNVARELTVESSLSADEVQQQLARALGRSDGLFTLDSDQGGSILVPVEKLAYIEFGEGEPRRVGFGPNSA